MSYRETISNLTQSLCSFLQSLVLLWGDIMSQTGYSNETVREILEFVSTS